MIFALELVTGPSIEPVTLAEAKRHLRFFDSDTSSDDDITALIQGGREWAEDFTSRTLVSQTWRLTIDNQRNFPYPVIPVTPIVPYGFYTGEFRFTRWGEIELMRAPVIEVLSIVTVDIDGTETTVDASSYQLREPDSKWPRLVMLNGGIWSSNIYKITFRAGFADTLASPPEGASAVPVRFKQAIKLWVEANYDRDEKMMPLLLQTAENLLRREIAQFGMA